MQATFEQWKENQQNAAMFTCKLVGDARYPDQYVGINPEDLKIHSTWAADMFEAPAPDSVWRCSSAEIVLPLQAPKCIVYQLVRALYRGEINLRHRHVEHLLLLSHAMQVQHCLAWLGLAWLGLAACCLALAMHVMPACLFSTMIFVTSCSSLTSGTDVAGPGGGEVHAVHSKAGPVFASNAAGLPAVGPSGSAPCIETITKEADA